VVAVVCIVYSVYELKEVVQISRVFLHLLYNILRGSCDISVVLSSISLEFVVIAAVAVISPFSAAVVGVSFISIIEGDHFLESFDEFIRVAAAGRLFDVG
jgi:hypothetical protein